jgi:DNA primase
VITFTQRSLSVDFPTAVRILAEEAKYNGLEEFDQEEIAAFGHVRECLAAAARIYRNALNQVLLYLQQRGISHDTAQRFMLGGASGAETLKNALLQIGFEEAIIEKSGLLNRHGQDRFQNHVLVPIFLNGQVVDFYGRSLAEDNRTGRHWRLPSERLAVGENLFNWNAQSESIILVEGMFDALALIDKGFPHAVASAGTNGLHAEILQHSPLRKVLVCFDGDAAGNGQALKRAYELKDSNLDVRIIDLPQGLDPNEYLLTHSADDFRGLVQKAATPEIWEIEHLDPSWDEHQKIEALEDLMLRVGTMDSLHRAALIKQISNKLGLKEKDVRGHIEDLSEKKRRVGLNGQPRIIDVRDYELIHPALHFGSKETLMTIPLMGTNAKTGRPEWQPWIMTSNGDLFQLDHEELGQRGYYCNDIVYPGRLRYSQAVITDFMEGLRQGDLSAIFKRMKATYQRYLDFSDPRTYDYLTAWTIGTYFFRIFNYYPYLHFTGTKEVGKSKAMKLMSVLCFNGIMSVSITDASQFRIITDLLPTLFLDESENLSDKGFTERRSLLLGGYEKGSTALRSEKVGDKWRTKEFENFSPRVFGSIDGLEDVLASRTVEIPMRRSYKSEIKEAEVDLTDETFVDLRDELFLVTMTFGDTIRRTYEQLQRPEDAEFDAREWNLFKPVMAIGTATGDSDVTQSLVGFVNATYSQKQESFNEIAVENVILRALMDIVKRDDWYSFDLIHRGILDFIRDQGLSIGSLHKNRLGKILHDLDLVAEKDRRIINGTKVTVYLLNPTTIEKVAGNYRVH